MSENLSLEEEALIEELVDATGEKYRNQIEEIVYNNVHPLFIEKAYRDGCEYGVEY